MHHRTFYLHVQPDSPLIEEVTSVVKPASIFTKDWEFPIRIVPTIQFFPEVNELLEGEQAIREYIASLKPRPLARERNLPQIKTKVEPVPEVVKPKTEVKPAPVVVKPKTEVEPQIVKPSSPAAPPTKIDVVRSSLTEEIQKATTKKRTAAPRKKSVRISAKTDVIS